MQNKRYLTPTLKYKIPNPSIRYIKATTTSQNRYEKKLEQNNLTITKADKGKKIVIINKNIITQKTEDFLNENQFTLLPKDPNNKFQKQLQQVLQECNKIIDKYLFLFVTI
jgi:hypothetical protein